MGKKPINADYSDLAKEIKINIKTSTFKVVVRVRITKYKSIFLVKIIPKTGQKKYL